MNELPKISILLPIFNGAKTLHRCVHSLLAQSFSSFEIVAIDDGSSDQSLQLMKSFVDPRIRSYRNKINRGLADTLNKAMQLSRGEFFARMDQDDSCHRTRLEKQINFLSDNPLVGLVGTGIQIYEKNQKTCSRLYPKTHQQIKGTMIFGSPCAHSTLMFRRKIYDHGIRYCAKYEFSEDWKFLYDCSKKYNLHNLRKILLDYHLTNTGIGRKHFNRAYAARKKVAKDILVDMGFPTNELSADSHLKASNPKHYENQKLRLICNQLLQIYEQSRKQTYVDAKTIKKESIFRLMQLMRKAKRQQIVFIISTGINMLRKLA